MDYTSNELIRQLICKEFMLPKHEEFRNLYFSKFDTTKLAFIKDHFYKDLESIQTIIPFKK